MTQIFFFSPDGYKPMKDAHLKSIISGSHGWSDTGKSWVFGVVTVDQTIHARQVVDRLKSLGIIPLPSLLDPDKPDLDSRIVGALAYLGVTPKHRAHEVVDKIFKASGNSLLAAECCW